MINRHGFIRVAISFCFIISTFQSKAQFVYGGVDLSYHNLVFNSNELFENTSLNDMRIHLNGTYRFMKRFGIGAQIDLPIYSRFKYYFIGNTTSGGFEYSFNSVDDSYSYGGSGIQSDVNYNIKNTSTISIYPRIYIGSTSGMFIDLRYNMINLQEEFTYSRSAYSGGGNAPALKATSQRYEETHTINGFGVQLGAFNQFSDHFYFHYSLIIDVYNFDDVSSFRYELPYTVYEGGYDNMVLKSMISGTHVSWQLSYGIGYYF